MNHSLYIGMCKKKTKKKQRHGSECAPKKERGCPPLDFDFKTHLWNCPDFSITFPKHFPV